MKEKIDITMTAVLRPALVSETLISIKENICRGEDDRYRLIINIDPIGENVDPAKVGKVANKNFKDVIINTPQTASFAKAVKWVWSKVEAPYVFHIEDDWKINRPINIDHMISILQKYKKLSSLRLYKYNTPNRKKLLTFQCYWIYNEEGFYLAKDWRKQFGLNPILIKKEFIDQALPNMIDTTNPEKQFRDSQMYMRSIIKNWQYGLYSNPGDPALAIDTGRKWITNTEFCKPKEGTFLTWIKK